MRAPCPRKQKACVLSPVVSELSSQAQLEALRAGEALFPLKAKCERYTVAPAVTKDSLQPARPLIHLERGFLRAGLVFSERLFPVNPLTFWLLALTWLPALHGRYRGRGSRRGPEEDVQSAPQEDAVHPISHQDGACIGNQKLSLRNP